MNNRLTERIIGNKKKDKSLSDFIQSFYGNANEAELKSIGEESLYEKAQDAYKFIQSRTPKKPKIEISETNSKDGRPHSILKVLNDDMPFLVDSVTAELNKFGLKIYEIYHPIISVERDSKSKFKKFSENGTKESLIYMSITYISEKCAGDELIDDLEQILKSVRLTVEDWQRMVKKAEESANSIKKAGKAFSKEEVQETEDFIKWLCDNHFTFLSYVEYKLDKNGKLKLVGDSKLGLARNKAGNDSSIVDAEVEHLAKSGSLVQITKSEDKAIVHRNVYMDQIGIKNFDKNGEMIGESWFSGLFASSAYYQTTDLIPLIRRKVRQVRENSGFAPGSHSAKIAQFILDSYPRDEIFQSTTKQLYANTISIIELIKRPRIGLFIRKDMFERYLTCLIYVPKEKFDTNLRYKLQDILEKELQGEVAEYYTQITDSPLSRLYLIIKPSKAGFADYNIERLTRKINDTANVWSDILMGVLFSHFGERKGEALYNKYENAFPESYLAVYQGDNAVHDIKKMEECLESNKIEVEIYQEAKQHGTNQLSLKTYNPGHQLMLSQILPILENLGFKVISEKPFAITPHGKETSIWLREFLLQTNGAQTPDIEQVKEHLQETLKKVIYGEVEDDSLNRLVLISKLNYRDVVLLRSYVKYLKQVGISFGTNFVYDALINQSALTTQIVDLFYAYFLDDDAKKAAKIEQDIKTALLNVSDLSEDTIIRKLVDAVQASLRTNFFQMDENGNPKNYVSIKLRSKKIPFLPKPHPYAEIFVYSPDVEGIHLRGGMVARGGLRWSDRIEDFRTEVLGLMKAQMVKNSVIVPVGSKGGFVCKKQLPTNREERMQAGIECYKTFLRGLLDITDNRVKDKIVPPKNVIRRDEDDPYLVVAADKGTASFSDIANSISAEYNFWLGDAFASGGSVGYDHKVMGITARGAWVGVQRHFREIGCDIQKEDFTCVGIGDMSGDVFGNGMLLSEHIKLLAAFNHMHIFIDPNPNPATSFKERERMFKLPRSSWEDYNSSYISKGGGIFSRSDKSIKITPEMKQALSISADVLTPNELIRAILVAPVDLLWNGGIGTYVKAESEENLDVGDKANDDLRINGGELNCKVVGEGGNLGFTQLGRIEYARKGGRINTDAIDNSAGVDCSDHEVNIKISLAPATESKKLTMKARNKLLEDMTEDVAHLVLRDNYLQTQALSIAESQGTALLEAQQSLIKKMEAQGELDREIEFLPSDAEIARRLSEKTALTRPELAVLLAYSKIRLYNELLDSNLPDEEYFKGDLLLYFPDKMKPKYQSDIEKHQLRREIVATFITNSIVNRTGSTFFHSVAKDTGMQACDIARTYTITRDAFGLRTLWKEIEALDGKINSDIQADMFVSIGQFIETMTFWFLRNLSHPLDVANTIKKFAKHIEEFRKKLDKLMTKNFAEAVKNNTAKLADKGVPKSLAKKICEIDAMTSTCDVALVVDSSKLPLETVGKIYFEIGSKLSFSWLRRQANAINGENYWERLALRNVVDSLFEQQRRIASEITSFVKKNGNSEEAVEAWLEKISKEVTRHKQMINELKSADKHTIPMLVSAVRRVEGLSSIKK